MCPDKDEKILYSVSIYCAEAAKNGEYDLQNMTHGCTMVLLRGGVKVPTGSDAANIADESASAKIFLRMNR